MLPAQRVVVPKCWLSKLYLSKHMLPFVADIGGAQAIIPVDASGRLCLDRVAEEDGWRRLDALYQRHKGTGKATPKTLVDRINYSGSLFSQPPHYENARRMVLYPTSGDIMRAARTNPGSGFVDSSLFWHVAQSEAEAGYLVALLNAPCLRQAFFESRESGRHFHLHPWRKVPLPRFDSQNPLHMELARLCDIAEEVAFGAAQDKPSASQPALSKHIRDRLAAEKISTAIDNVVAQLLPDQAVLPHGGTLPLSLWD